VLTPAPVAVIAETPRAGLLLKPLRLRILAEAREPVSATGIATRLGLARQKVNYHVRELARAGFLRRAGRQRKRGLTEQRYVVTAQAFLLGPSVLGPMSAEAAAATDKATAAYLMTLGAQMQREAGTAWRQAQAAGQRVPILSLDSEVQFASSEARARFAQALSEAVTRIVAEHATPSSSGSARPYRLVLGCYPMPARESR
jgi:biotin operon repressor